MTYLLEHGHLIVDGNREFMDGAILIEKERIKDVFSQTNKVILNDENIIRVDLKGKIVMPGAFDSHLHGLHNISFDTADFDDLQKAALFLAKSGTTSFIASLSYDFPSDQYLNRLKYLEKFQSDAAHFFGIHMEGPFLSTKHLGVAFPEKLLKPDYEMVKELVDNCNILKQMTIAYELEGAKEIGALLKERGIKVMVGHSDALASDLDENVDGFTHLFNAMRGLHHRDITLVNLAFSNKYYCELIADGNHINENVLRLLVNNIDRHKIILVSDSSTARGLKDGEYEFLSNPCTKIGTSFKTHSGHFAGSVVSINDCLQVLHRLGVKYNDLLLYSSLNAFEFYGLQQNYGTISKGKFADLVISDDDLNIEKVMLKGEFI